MTNENEKPTEERIEKEQQRGPGFCSDPKPGNNDPFSRKLKPIGFGTE